MTRRKRNTGSLGKRIPEGRVDAKPKSRSRLPVSYEEQRSQHSQICRTQWAVGRDDIGEEVGPTKTLDFILSKLGSQCSREGEGRGRSVRGWILFSVYLKDHTGCCGDSVSHKSQRSDCLKDQRFFGLLFTFSFELSIIQIIQISIKRIHKSYTTSYIIHCLVHPCRK